MVKKPSMTGRSLLSDVESDLARPRLFERHHRLIFWVSVASAVISVLIGAAFLYGAYLLASAL